MSKIYPKYKEARLGDGLGLNSDPVKVLLVGQGYVPNFSTDEFVEDIQSGARVSISPALTNKTYTNGVFASDATIVSAVPAGQDVVALVIFLDTGDAATSRLVYYADSGTGLPYTPNGSDFTITWNASGIFQG